MRLQERSRLHIHADERWCVDEIMAVRCRWYRPKEAWRVEDQLSMTCERSKFNQWTPKLCANDPMAQSNQPTLERGKREGGRGHWDNLSRQVLVLRYLLPTIYLGFEDFLPCKMGQAAPALEQARGSP